MVLLAGHVAEAGAQANDAARIERGRTVYQEQKCQACHAIAGTGNRRNPLDGVGAKLDADAIRKWIVAPQEMNPTVRKRGYATLPPADLEALIAYLRSVPPAKR